MWYIQGLMNFITFTNNITIFQQSLKQKQNEQKLKNDALVKIR